MSVVAATIKSGGKTLSMEYELLNITISREVNRIPWAELILVAGNPANPQFALSEEDTFEPGKKVEIQLRYEGDAETVFKGLVVRHNLEVNAQDATLTVELKDAAIGMTMGRNSAVLAENPDFFNKLVENGAAKTDEELIQYYCSDWDFMLSRAAVHNLLVVVNDGEVSLKELLINETEEPKHHFKHGLNEIYSFEIEVDAGDQYESVESVAWDIKTQALTKSSAVPFKLTQGNLDGGVVAGKLGGKKYSLNSTAPIDPEEIESWANGTMARTRMSFLRGVITVPGFADIQLMEVMEISGIGKRFDGKTLVTGIRHTVDHEGWQTAVQFGLSAEPFYRTPDIMDAPAAGLLPGVNGLQIGIVQAFEADEKAREFRVRVLLPGIDPDKGQVWARLAGPEAGKGRGYFFRPEEGDEVVVGFFNDDPRQAVILGALFSRNNVPPKEWGEKLNAENALKGIVSKTGITMEINDQEQTLKLLTSEKQSILMDEKNKLIKIMDRNENTITLDDKGIHIESKGDLEFKGKNIKLHASRDVEIKGKSVDVK